MSKTRVQWLKGKIPEISQELRLSEDQKQLFRNYCDNQLQSTSSPLPTILAILGSLLIGLGIILIFAHNWKIFSQEQKSVLAVVPFLAITIYSGIRFYKDQLSSSFRESSSLLQLLTFAAAVALVSQAYHMPGSLSAFMTLVMAVALPMLYLYKSNSMLTIYFLGITWLPFTYHRWYNTETHFWIYWVFFLGALPYLVSFFRNNSKESPFTTIFLWIGGISLLFTPFTSFPEFFIDDGISPLLFLTIATTFVATDSLLFNHEKSGWHAPLRTLGKIVLLFIYIIFSYSGVFDEIKHISVFAVVLLIIPPVVLSYILFKNGKRDVIPFLIPAVLFFAEATVSMTEIFTFLLNISLIALGIHSMKSGINLQILRRVNFGFTMIASVILLRFFDTKLPFTIRGIIFILLGTAFLITNVRLSKKKKVTHA